MKPAKKGTQKAPKDAGVTGKTAKGFTAEEREAMKEHIQELKAEARGGRPGGGKVDGESEVLAKIAALPQPDRAMAERLHGIIKANAPRLSPRTWYGMPADSVEQLLRSAAQCKAVLNVLKSLLCSPLGVE